MDRLSSSVLIPRAAEVSRDELLVLVIDHEAAAVQVTHASRAPHLIEERPVVEIALLLVAITADGVERALEALNGDHAQVPTPRQGVVVQPGQAGVARHLAGEKQPLP